VVRVRCGGGRMIRLVELSPAAGDELVKQLKDERIAHRRRGTQFMFVEGEMPHKMRRLSNLVGYVLAKFGQSHLIEDKYV